MSAAKDKGTRHETSVVRSLSGFFLGRYGLKPRRTATAGFQDPGDIHGVSPFIIQAKNWDNITSALNVGVKGAVVQAQRAGEMYGVAVVKKPNVSVGDCYAVLRLQDFARVLLRLRRAEALLAQHAPLAYYSHMADTADEKSADFPKA